MSRRRLPVVTSGTDPLAQRIAVGLHKLGLAMKQQAWLSANEDGVSPTQGQILAVLVAEPGRTSSELAAALGLSLPTISDAVRVLVEKGLVRRAPDPRHPRASLLSPTPHGAKLGQRARSWPEFLADAVDALAPTEQAAFFSGLVKMIRTLQEQGAIPTSGMCVDCSYFRPRVRAGATPHHCELIDAPLADTDLRIDCPDHERAADGLRAANWSRLLA